MAATQAQEAIQVSISEDGTHRISRGTTTVDITPAGDTTVFARGDIKLRALTAEEAAAEEKEDGLSVKFRDDFSTVAACGVTVTLEKEHVRIVAANTAQLRPSLVPEEMKIGTRMRDGCLYAGVSPSTGEPMYVAPADEKPRFGWQLSTPGKARKRAEKRSRETGQEYRVPTWAELKVLFNNRAAIGGFNESESYPGSWYRSYTPGLEEGADRRQLFSTGAECSVYGDYGLSVRLVRN